MTLLYNNRRDTKSIKKTYKDTRYQFERQINICIAIVW